MVSLYFNLGTQTLNSVNVSRSDQGETIRQERPDLKNLEINLQQEGDHVTVESERLGVAFAIIEGYWP